MKPSVRDDRASNASAIARRSSRVSRKVQPGIRNRAESFLARVGVNSDSVPKSSLTLSTGTLESRKRKLADFRRGEEIRSTSPATRIITHKEKEKEHDDPKSLGTSKLATSKRAKVISAEDHHIAEGSTKKTGKKDEEKRARMFRKQAPQKFLEKLSRAQTQRMIVVGRTKTGTEAFPREEIDIVGSTGNIYRVTIGQTCSCTCPDSKKGNECKHKVYALHTVLKAPEKLQYQLALLSSELREIFANAPPIPTDFSSSDDKDGNRKAVEGECPICYMDFDEENNELVWCQAACGNNMHKDCFDQWAASHREQTVKCVYCRTPWHVDHGDLQSLTKAGSVTQEGYVNVADAFGMRRARDYSSYHQPWVRRNMGMGW